MLKMKLVECPMVSTYKAVFDNIVMGEYTLDLDKAVETGHGGIYS